MCVGVIFLVTTKSGVGAGLLGFGAVLMFAGGRNKEKWEKS